MGLSIHYRGCFSSKASLAAMIEEVQDIARVFRWPCHVFETAFPADAFGIESFDGELYGISVTPPRCETLSLTFLSNGRMSSAIGLRLYGKDYRAQPGGYLYDLFVKTQFAGKETHMLVVNLLRHISRNYFSEFEASDEGGYWESNDEAQLETAFNKYTRFFHQVVSGIQSIPMHEGESFEEYLARILKRDA